MKTFEQVMEVTGGISGSAALEDVEAKGLYDACLTVPVGGLVVEVGCQLGRSSSLITQMAAEGGFRTVHIDPYTSQPEYLKGWVEMMHRVGGDWTHEFTLLCMRTEQAEWQLEKFGPIDLAFIDGDHEAPSVRIDLRLVADKVKQGGMLTMHDYGRDSLPGVYQAASEYIDDRWEPVGVYGTLGVWRRR